MIITISGTPGSGKSTIAKILENKLGAERIYVGGIRRELARQKGWTLEQLNEYAQTHPETDVDIDQQASAHARQLEKKGNIIVAEGRTQFHFLPESIKIYITVSPEEGARRIWNDLQHQELQQQRNEGKIVSLEQLKRSLAEREEGDTQRYTKYYGFDHRDEKYYDLIIDTTSLRPEQAAQKILDFVQAHKKNAKKNL